MTRRPSGIEGELTVLFAQLCAQLGGCHKIPFRASLEVVKSISLHGIIWQESLERRLARGWDIFPISGERQTDDSASILLGKVTHRTAELGTPALESDGLLQTERDLSKHSRKTNPHGRFLAYIADKKLHDEWTSRFYLEKKWIGWKFRLY